VDHNPAYLVVAGLLALCALAVLAVLVQWVRGIGAPQYERVDLFSAAERSFLGVLERVFGDEYRVLAKVNLADIIRPRKGLSNSAWRTAMNRIDRKHVDFVLCDRQTLAVVAIIELDDSSHKRSRAKRGDETKNKALAAAGIPMVRIAAKRGYTPADVREQISGMLG
jgi:very-short-patch-repair endonuclease